MPSERRLHPWTLLFNLAGQARQFAVPLLLALFVGSRGDNMELWALPILVPYTIGVAVRFISFRYEFGDGGVGDDEEHRPALPAPTPGAGGDEDEDPRNHERADQRAETEEDRERMQPPLRRHRRPPPPEGGRG